VRLRRGERIVVDEAGMLDQDTALALLRLADEAGASVALVGDRAQLPAVGRGGVLDIAAQVCPRTLDMATVHRFTDPQYADLSVRLRRGEDPAALFDRLHALGLVVLHASTEDAREQFTTALQRDRADRGLTDATRAATRAVVGLVDDGPVAVVNAERARLLERIQTADREATRCDDVLGALTRQNAEHRAAREQQTQVVAAADAHLARARAVAAAPLLQRASADGADYLATQQRMWQANRATSTAGRFGRRAAARTACDATQAHGTT